jgi:hypothetical protein
LFFNSLAGGACRRKLGDGTGPGAPMPGFDAAPSGSGSCCRVIVLFGFLRAPVVAAIPFCDPDHELLTLGAAKRPHASCCCFVRRQPRSAHWRLLPESEADSGQLWHSGQQGRRCRSLFFKKYL